MEEIYYGHADDSYTERHSYLECMQSNALRERGRNDD